VSPSPSQGAGREKQRLRVRRAEDLIHWSLLDEAGWVDADGDGVREKDGARLEVLFWAWT
jgi:hypothetical protein